MLTGLGVLTMALFPLSIPIVLLTAVSLLPLLPVVILGGLVAAAALGARAVATATLSRRARRGRARADARDLRAGRSPRPCPERS
ncbi:MAG: hypothetical protein ACRDKX_04255 [Solirubrobacterales bacterium]